MKKLFLLIPALVLTMMAYATTPGLNKTTPVTLMAADATLSANGSIVTDSITWPESTIHEGFAKWRVNIADMGYYSVTLDMRSNNTFFFRISVVDPATGDTLRQSRSPKKESNKVYAAADCGTLNLRGLEAGEYDIVVTDTIQWSHGKVASMTLTYAGGLTINIPANPLNGADAVLGKTGEKYMLRTEEGYLKSHDNVDPTSEYAYWHIHATKGGNMKVTANVAAASTTTHDYHVELYSDLNASALSSTAEPSSTSSTGARALTPELVIPEAGDYYIKLVNHTQYSSSILSSIAFEYKGGNPIEIPQTLIPDDAMLSSRAWVDETGTVDSILFTPRGSEGYNPDEWAKWRIKVTEPGYYKFTANVTSSNGQYYKISVWNRNETVTIGEKDGTGSSLGSGDKTFATGKIQLEAGVYVVKIANTYANSTGRVRNIIATYEGGKTIDIPGTLLPQDAILSPRAWVDKSGTVDSILFTPRGSEGYNLEEWAKWKVNVTTQSYYNFTAHVCRPSGSQKYEIKVYNSDETVEKISNTNESMSSGNQTISTGRVELMPGVYVVKVRNTYEDANSRLLKIVATYEGGNLIDVPASLSLLPEDAILSDSAGVVSGSPDYINFKVRGSHMYNSTEWAKWRINVTEACSYIFTANVSATTGQKYNMYVLSADESTTIGQKIGEDTYMYSGDKTFVMDPVALSEGEYIVKIMNPYKNSDGCVKSISVAQATPVTLSEEDTNLDGLTADATVDIELTRSLVAGMYNTICLPFAVSAAEMSRVFPGAVVKELTSSSIEEGEFVLNLNFSAVSEMEAGVPYIIKPAANITNPKFIGVTINKTLNSTNTTNANFVGIIIKGTIPASENNLFMGANNTLYFPTVDTDILGMRGYFVIHDAPAGVIQRARIVEADAPAVTTDINRVEVNASVKTIENGQLVIIRDGKKYNVMGVRMK